MGVVVWEAPCHMEKLRLETEVTLLPSRLSRHYDGSWYGVFLEHHITHSITSVTYMLSSQLSVLI